MENAFHALAAETRIPPVSMTGAALVDLGTGSYAAALKPRKGKPPLAAEADMMSNNQPKPSVLGTAILGTLITLWAILIVVADDAVGATIDHYARDRESATRMRLFWAVAGIVLLTISAILILHYKCPCCRHHPLAVGGNPDFVGVYSELHLAQAADNNSRNGQAFRLPGSRQQHQ